MVKWLDLSRYHHTCSPIDTDDELLVEFKGMKPPPGFSRFSICLIKDDGLERLDGASTLKRLEEKVGPLGFTQGI